MRQTNRKWCKIAMSLLLTGSLLAGTAVASAETKDGLIYNVNTIDKTCDIVGYSDITNQGLVVIPEKLDDNKVTQIKAGAFAQGKAIRTVAVYGDTSYETVGGAIFASPSAITFYGKAGSPTQIYATSVGAGFVAFAEVKDVKATKTASLTKAKVSWSAQAGVTEYKVYRKAKATDEYGYLNTYAATSFTDTGLTGGKTYYYTIVPVLKTANGDTLDGIKSAEAKVVLKPGKIKKFKARSRHHMIKLSWKRDKNVTGYVLQSKSHPKIKGIKWNFCHMKTLKSNKKTSLKNVKLVSGMRYSYRIRAYKKVNGKKVYGDWSVINKKKCK